MTRSRDSNQTTRYDANKSSQAEKEVQTLDWPSMLNLDKALYNCRNDILGDWYRDPWGWPEMDWAVEKRPEVITARLNSSGSRRAARIDVAKENFGIRPALILDPIDRVVYQSLVDMISDALIGSMPGWVHGWRLPPAYDSPGSYARNDHQWTRLIHKLTDAASSATFMLKTDIVSFFSSIPIPAFNDRLLEVGGHHPAAERLCGMLSSWNRIPDRSGLPQRSAASAVLANMYLTQVDQLISSYTNSPKSRKVSTAFRWMDDLWLFGNDEGELRGVQVELQRELRALGLEMNLPKTALFTGKELRAEIERLDLTGLDYFLTLNPPDNTALQMLDRILEEVTARPEQASRTTIKFVTTRMRWRNIYTRVAPLIKTAPHMPQGADSLARLFRDSGVWHDLTDWYLDYALGPWGKIDWSVAQLGTMFALNGHMPIALEEFFVSLLGSNQSLALTALAAQRLAASGSDEVRYFLREAATFSDNPMHRRVLALSAIQAGEPRTVIRRILSEFEENSVTLEMLEDRGFRSVKPVPDFTGRPGRSK